MLKKSLLAVLALLISSAVLRAGDIVDEIIARVNDAIITRGDYEKARQRDQEDLQGQFPNDWQTRWDQQQKDTLRGLIDQQLLLDKGKELGITGDTELVKRLNQMRQQMGLPSMDALEEEAKKQGISFEDYKDQIKTGIVAEQVIGREVGARIHISDEDVQDFYKKHQKELEGVEEVNLNEILVSTQPPKPPAENTAAETNKEKTPELSAPLVGTDQKKPEEPAVPIEPDEATIAKAELKAKGLLEELRKGAKFEDVAKQNSDGPTAAEGGRLGTFKRGELAKDFEDKTFSLKAGEFTDLIRTKQGFIILKVNGHRAPGVPPLKEVEENIKQAIYGERLAPAARTYLSKLRDESYIEVKAGFTDTGASPNQNKPIMIASAADAATSKQAHAKKKKKHMGVF